jgi:tRNA dimethylallyltransferase
MEIPRLITILGPTAVGKTRLAALLSEKLNGEILSADSRQVYRGMTIGTGKDLDDYVVSGKSIKFHIIDVAHPNEEFHVFKFKQLFIKTVADILSRQIQPVLCGGTGMYLDAVLRDYFFVEVPENKELRRQLDLKTTDELALLLQTMKKVHNKTDLTDRSRLYRAIEIQEFHNQSKANPEQIRIKDSKVFGVLLPREMIRQRIAERLDERLKHGMIEEVESLINQGVSHQRLLSFGLEYKFVTMYLLGKMGKEEMQEKLCISIQQFAKRQMSWFRRMERMGVNIQWIDGMPGQEERVLEVLRLLSH